MFQKAVEKLHFASSMYLSLGEKGIQYFLKLFLFLKLLNPNTVVNVNKYFVFKLGVISSATS